MWGDDRLFEAVGLTVLGLVIGVVVALGSVVVAWL